MFGWMGMANERGDHYPVEESGRILVLWVAGRNTLQVGCSVKRVKARLLAVSRGDEDVEFRVLFWGFIEFLRHRNTIVGS